MTLTTSILGDIAIVEIDNPPVNALSAALRQDLLDAVARLDRDRSVRSVVLLCAGRTFIAGADVKEFGREPQPPHLPDVISAIEKAQKPWVAAMHGNALGGGLEVAMGCAYRVAAPGTKFGLPEVTLGLIPGAGGTVRLPRLIGIEAAIDLVTSGAPVGADKALALGLIDAVLEEDLREAALGFARAAFLGARPPQLSALGIERRDDTFWASRETALAQQAKGAVAPLRALASIRCASASGFDAAMAFERETFLELRSSEQARALRHLFFAERAAPRPPELSDAVARAIRHAAVIGGGTMGAGIAVALRDAGLPVMLIERDAAAVERGMTHIRALYAATVKRGRLTEEAAAEKIAGISGSTDYGVLADVDLVIEAVFEDLAVKRSVFAQLSDVCRPDAILATNTSYLDPARISADLPHPERFLGLHFFSPAHVMKLLEIVATPATGTSTLATAFALARMLGKIPVRSGICDGFIGNRILKVTRAQAERLLLSGCTPSAVDQAMRAFGMPMGPFEAQDLGGLDIAAFQRKAARERGDTVFAPIAERLCAMGRFGQKTGGGWYDYMPGARGGTPSETVGTLVAEARQGDPQRDWDEPSIVEMIVYPMINEAASILDEKIALRSADVDLVEVHGYGFPRWRGGLMHHGETLGLKRIVEQLGELCTRGLAAAPCRRLIEASETGRFER